MTYVEGVRTCLVAAFPKLGEVHRKDLLDQYTLLVLVKGEEVTPEDVHDAWSVRMSYIRPDHWSIVPFSELSEEVQERDVKYALAIQGIAQALREKGLLKKKVG